MDVCILYACMYLYVLASMCICMNVSLCPCIYAYMYLYAGVLSMYLDVICISTYVSI